MEAKEKFIKKVYGEYFEPLKDFIDENGWCRNRKISGFYNQLFHIQFHPTINYWYRPAALKNIENNNGWIRIESEKDLPKDDEEYILGILRDGHFAEQGIHNAKLMGHYFQNKAISHYRPIEARQPPLF